MSSYDLTEQRREDEQVKAETRNTATCGDCGETVYFVDGLVGKERWKHARTDDWRCHPLCKECGGEGRVQIGIYDMDGGQVPYFRRKYWLCADCAKASGRLFIEHT